MWYLVWRTLSRWGDEVWTFTITTSFVWRKLNFMEGTLYKSMSLHQMLLYFRVHSKDWLICPWRFTSTSIEMGGRKQLEFNCWYLCSLHVYGKATIFFDGYSGGPSTKVKTHQRRTPQITNKVTISDATKFVGKNGPFSRQWYEQAGPYPPDHRSLVTERRPCYPCWRKDVDIMKAAITISFYKSTTLIR